MRYGRVSSPIASTSGSSAARSPAGMCSAVLRWKAAASARRQRVAAGLDGPAHVVDEQRPAHQRVAGAHHGEVVLACSLLWRIEQLRVEAPQPRQPPLSRSASSRSVLRWLPAISATWRGLATTTSCAEVRHDAAQPRRARSRLERPAPAGGRSALRPAPPPRCGRAARVSPPRRRRARGRAYNDRPRRGRR